MPVNIDIYEFKCFNQLRNGSNFSLNASDFTPNLVGNIGETLRVTFKAAISQSAFANASEEWTIFTALNEIVRSSGSFWDDAVQVGDKFDFYADWLNRKSAVAEYSGTVNFISGDGRTLRYTVDSGAEVTTGTVTNVGLSFPQLNATNLNTALFLKFGLIGNDETFNYQSKTTEAPQVYYRGELVASTPALAESLGKIKDWVTGSATFTLQPADPDFDGAEYLVEHDFILSPFYILSFREFIDAGTIPDILAGDSSLKYAAELEFRKTLTNTGSSKLRSFDNLLGFVGWYSENFNGLNAKYRIKSVAYEDALTGDPLDGLNISLNTKVTIVVESLVGPITGFNAGVYVARVPTSESQYIGTESTLVSNFLYKSETLTSPTVAGVDLSGSIVAGELVLTYFREYTTPEKLQLSTDDEFMLWVQVEDPTGAAGNSDRIALLAPIANFVDEDFLAGFVETVSYNFLMNNDVLDTDTGSANIHASNEDGIILDALIGADVTKGVVINGIAGSLVAFNPITGESFQLDSYTFSLGDPVLVGGVQEIAIETNRGYPLPSGDPFNIVKITTEGQVGDFNRFRVQLGQKIKWQEWLFNSAVDPVFFNAAEPNNNLNEKSSNYSGIEDYDIYLSLTLNVTGEDDLGRSLTGDLIIRGGVISVEDYGESAIGVTGVIETYDVDVVASLGGGILYNGKDTLFRAVFQNAGGYDYAIHRIEPSENPGDGILELSSILPPVSPNLLKPLEGETLLKATLVGSELTTECLIDGSLITEGVSYKLSARVFALIVPPSDLAAVAVSGSQIDLSWTNPAVYSGLTVYRSTTEGGPYTLVSAISGLAVSFNDTGLSADTKYFYVIAPDGGDLSNEAFAKTFAFALQLDGINDYLQAIETLALGDGTTGNFSLYGWSKTLARVDPSANPIFGADSSDRLELINASPAIGNNGSQRLITQSAGRRGDVTLLTTPITAYGAKIFCGFNKITNNAAVWTGAQNGYQAGVIVSTNTLLAGDVLNLKNPLFGDTPFAATGNIILKSYLIIQPDISSAQYTWLYNGGVERNFGELSSAEAKAEGIGVFGVDTIGVGGITVLVKRFVDFGILTESGGIYYAKEFVTNNSLYARCYNFTSPPASLVLFT
jgi:hypothetical protein